MAPSGGAEDEDWGTWESTRRRRLIAGLQSTPTQRLAWLEEMIAVAHRTGALPRRRKEPDQEAF
jgi:hypothetical protein